MRGNVWAKFGTEISQIAQFILVVSLVKHQEKLSHAVVLIFLCYKMLTMICTS